MNDQLSAAAGTGEAAAPVVVLTFRSLMRRPIDLDHPLPYVSPAQIADFVGHRPSWVWRKIHSRQLVASRWSGSGELRVAWADFLAFLAAGRPETEELPCAMKD